MRTIPPTSRLTRAGSPAGSGISASAASTLTAMTITFATVPIPGRWRSGIHSRSTTTPVTAVTRPKLSGRCWARPWWNTSQGFRPSVARICIAMLVP